MKFLIVDDFKIMRRIVAGMLTELGHNDVVEADGAATALPLLQNGAFDVVIVSWKLLDVVQAVRADARLARLPVLVQTAEDKHGVAATQAGGSGVLMKPFKTPALKAAIEQILAHAR